MYPKKHKKKRMLLHLNRVRILTEFEYAQLKYVHMLTNLAALSISRVLFFMTQDLRSGKSNSLGDFFFVHPVISSRLQISVLPGLKNFKILSRSSVCQNLLRISLKKPRNFFFKSNLLKKCGEPVSFKKARYLAFFEYGLTLFEQRNFNLGWARRATFLSFESWYNHQSLVSTKYAKVAGSFIIYPYWVNTVLLSWTWLFWWGYQEATLFIASPARLLGSFHVRWVSRRQEFNSAASVEANLRMVSGEVSSAVLDFYLFVLLFLYMLDARQISFIKLLETLKSGSRRTSVNLGLGNVKVLVPKPLQISSMPTFGFFNKSWSNLFTNIYENIKRFTLVKLTLTQAYHLSLIQSRLSLDIADSLTKFELSKLLMKQAILPVSSVRIVNLRRHYEGFFTFNNLFRPKFLSFCLVWQAFCRVLILVGIRIYAIAFSKLVFFSIKQMFIFFFLFFFKKRLFFSKYFVLSFLRQSFSFKIRVAHLVLNTIFNFRIWAISSGLQRLLFFMQLGLIVIFCYLAGTLLAWGVLFGISWFVCVNFYKFSRTENVNFFSIFRGDFLFSGKMLTRWFYYTMILFTGIFDVLWAFGVLYGLIRAVLLCMQLYFRESWGYLKFLINFWLPVFFSVYTKKSYSLIYCSSVKVCALVCRQFFEILRINLLLADYWHFCSLISVREFTWLLLGFVQIFWAQLAWWRYSGQNIQLWRQIFNVNKILFASGSIHRGPVLGDKLAYISIFDHLANFLGRRRFLFWNSNFVSKFKENFILYFSFLSSSKINLLRLNWYTTLRLIKVRRSEVPMQAKILTQSFWKIEKLLKWFAFGVYALAYNFLDFLIYWIQRTAFLFFLVIQFSLIVLFISFLIKYISSFLLFYLIVKFFLLMFILSNFKS